MVRNEFRILTEHLVLGMVCIDEETEIQSLHISQYIQKCHGADTAQALSPHG